jgi:hypothetical protein
LDHCICTHETVAGDGGDRIACHVLVVCLCDSILLKKNIFCLSNYIQVWPFNIRSTTWPTCRCWDHAWGKSTTRRRSSVPRNYLSLWMVNQIIISYQNR